jgi:hypothetical protein
MIVDPIRHITDILALGGMVAFAYLFARTVNAISDAMARTERMAAGRAPADPALQPAAVEANDNVRDAEERRLAA